jgi:hypothetical protein
LQAFGIVTIIFASIAVILSIIFVFGAPIAIIGLFFSIIFGIVGGALACARKTAGLVLSIIFWVGLIPLGFLIAASAG